MECAVSLRSREGVGKGIWHQGNGEKPEVSPLLCIAHSVAGEPHQGWVLVVGGWR